MNERSQLDGSLHDVDCPRGKVKEEGYGKRMKYFLSEQRRY